MHRKHVCIVLTILLLIGYTLVFFTYFVNSPTLICGLSLPLMYSFIVWIYIIVIIVLLAKFCWR